MSAEDIGLHREELRKEWGKPQGLRNSVHIKSFLKSTRQDRVDILAKHPDGSISSLLERYPCLTESEFVSITYHNTAISLYRYISD